MSGTHSTLSNHHWWSYPLNADNPAQLTIDLNENYILTTVQVWNYNESGVTVRSSRNVEIHVSPDNDPLNLVKLFTNGTGLFDNGTGDFLFPQGPGQATYTGFELDLTSVTNASLLSNVRLIQIKPINSYDNSAGVGLAEVQFGGVIAPEPSTALLAAFAGLALARRRR